MPDSQTVRAYAESIALTPRKVSLVASLVRGRSVDDALVILSHTPKRAALPVKKTIESAKANAINNHGLDGKTLEISTLSVTSSVRLKRFKPAAMGRPRRFQKKTANILVEVTGDIKPVKTTVKKAESADKADEKEKK
jgi:large subunit ribosomal protein L22